MSLEVFCWFRMEASYSLASRCVLKPRLQVCLFFPVQSVYVNAAYHMVFPFFRVYLYAGKIVTSINTYLSPNKKLYCASVPLTFFDCSPIIWVSKVSYEAEPSEEKLLNETSELEIA